MPITLPIYLDYMATTPVDERVAKKMRQYLTVDGIFGNPASSTHLYGWKASEAVELARQQIADLIHTDARELIFTSGATESINLALKGAARAYQRKGKHIITATTEHNAVLGTCKQLESEGFEVTYLNPESNGLLDLNKFSDALRNDTILASIMHVNNEIGVIQPIQSMTEITRPRGILFHVDAAQSAGKLNIDVNTLNVDLMSLTAHKLYGPKGIGALFVRQNPPLHLKRIIDGSDHERGLRAGTLPTHQIVGMGEAYYLANQEREENQLYLSKLSNKLWEGISQVDGVHLNGDKKNRVPNNLNVSIEGVDGGSLLMALKNLAVSSGSACTSASIEPSHVLRAIGLPDELAYSSIRFSVGRYTKEQHIDYAIDEFKEKIQQLRDMSPLWND